MRTRRDLASPWGYRVWYHDSEFDTLMDEARERAAVDLFTPGSGIDVEELLLRVYGISPDFAADLPDEVLGRTLFSGDGQIEIEINRTLSERAEHDRTARRRLRSTLGHECAHVVGHAHLQVSDGTLSLFEYDEPRQSRVLCRSVSIQLGGAGVDWWEYQANRGMASLLLPRPILKTEIPTVLGSCGYRTVTAALADGRGKEVINAIADLFDISFEMTLYRLQSTGFIPDMRQGTLAATG